MIKLYIGGQFENRHEVEQFNNVLKIIEENKNNLGKFCIIFGCVYISGEELDCLILKEDAIIAIEMKSWNGNISGSENGDWNANGRTLNNVFRQCGRKRWAVMDKLNEIFSNQKFDVSSWAVFDHGANCSGVKVDEKFSKSFRAVSLNDLGKELLIERAKKTLSSFGIIQRVISDLNLQEKNFSDWMATKPDATFEETQHLIPKISRNSKEYVIKKNFSQEYVIRYPVSNSDDLIMICFVRNKSTGKEYLSIAPRIPLKIWKEIEEYILKVEHSWDKLKKKEIKIPEKNHIIRVGPLCSHNRDGIQIEILEGGNSQKRIWFNMNSIQKLQEIILERRN